MSREICKEIVCDVADHVVIKNEATRESDQKESLANQACDSILNLIIGEDIFKTI